MSRTHATQRKHRQKVGGTPAGLAEHNKRAARRRARRRRERELQERAEDLARHRLMQIRCACGRVSPAIHQGEPWNCSCGRQYRAQVVDQ